MNLVKKSHPDKICYICKRNKDELFDFFKKQWKEVTKKEFEGSGYSDMRELIAYHQNNFSEDKKYLKQLNIFICHFCDMLLYDLYQQHFEWYNDILADKYEYEIISDRVKLKRIIEEE